MTMRAAPLNIEILLDSEAIAARVAEMGRQITRDYQDKNLTILVILKGSFLFAADLVRHIDLPLHVDFMGVRSYGDQQKSSGVVQITLDPKHPVTGEDVLVVEDIVDTGLTMAYLRDNLLTRRPRSLRIAALLHKPARTVVEVPIDYLGFTITDRYVVGYGLDSAGRYRNLPYIGAFSDA
jgi:hypoxanthine phosphoribosyltransferase